ncbi:MAG: prepilin-type N-terminal cleavage/methylation domain-containing protein [Opitutaceae bacterium]|nr:prepilin-type N-terminal cleavage/methylation domain-containing protein [Opitutaceae bacterium]
MSLRSIPLSFVTTSRSARGFTLIELLTGIAIIGILAAIIIPTVGKVRTSARTAQSGSNLREIHRATVLLAEQNRGRFPNADPQLTKPAPHTYYTIWDSANGLPSILYPERAAAVFPSRTTVYAQNAFWDGTVFQSPAVEESATLKISYAPNDRLFNTQWTMKPFFMQSYNPSAVVLYGDVRGTNSLRWQVAPTAAGALNARNGASSDFAQNGRAMVVYLDGHVRSLGAAEAAEFSAGTTTAARRAWGIE